MFLFWCIPPTPLLDITLVLKKKKKKNKYWLGIQRGNEKKLAHYFSPACDRAYVTGAFDFAVILLLFSVNIDTGKGKA